MYKKYKKRWTDCKLRFHNMGPKYILLPMNQLPNWCSLGCDEGSPPHVCNYDQYKVAMEHPYSLSPMICHWRIFFHYLTTWILWKISENFQCLLDGLDLRFRGFFNLCGMFVCMRRGVKGRWMSNHGKGKSMVFYIKSSVVKSLFG